jgi:hypothetical protein
LSPALFFGYKGVLVAKAQTGKNILEIDEIVSVLTFSQIFDWKY